jgi:predicted RNA-binding protein (virulence factor B family)
MHYNETIRIGEMNRLKVARATQHGLYLIAKNGEEVLLPARYVDMTVMEIGTYTEVFVHTDSEDRLVATTRRPSALLGEFGFFEVVETKHYGAFVDWGLDKDLFVPLSQQKRYFKTKDRYVLRVCFDERTRRLYASQRVGRFLQKASPKHVKPEETYEMIILARTPLGFKVIVDHRFEGMLFDNEIFELLSVGERKQGYVKRVRDDGKIDMTLRPAGLEAKSLEAQKKVIRYLTQQGGMMRLTSKSAPEAIRDALQMSKKDFKRALTALKEEGHIETNQDEVRLVLGKSEGD